MDAKFNNKCLGNRGVISVVLLALQSLDIKSVFILGKCVTFIIAALIVFPVSLLSSVVFLTPTGALGL